MNNVEYAVAPLVSFVLSEHLRKKLQMLHSSKNNPNLTEKTETKPKPTAPGGKDTASNSEKKKSSVQQGNTGVKLTASEKFWNDRQDNWINPIKGGGAKDPTKGSRYFGANREEGERAHAGIDFVVPPGTEVIAMTDGEVIRISKNFYGGTDAVEVRCSDGSIIRYAEISVSVKEGQKISQGEKIGSVIKNNIGGSSMLHLEVYAGTESGPLTQPDNKEYDYLPDKNYKRRSDLIDPTGAMNLKVVS